MSRLIFLSQTSRKDSDDSSFGFHHDRNRRRNDSHDDKKDNCQKKLFKDVFVYAEDQTFDSFSLGFKLMMKVINSTNVIHHALVRDDK